MPVAIPWYRLEEWSRWKEISTDLMCESHESWLEGVENALKKFTKSGIEVHCVEIAIAEFCQWAKLRALPCNSYTRGEFAMFKLSKRLLMPDPKDEDIPSLKEAKAIAQKMKGFDMSEIWEPYLRRPKAAVCPIMRDSRGKLEQFGSGVLIRIGDAHFLLSAAHVGDEIEKDGLMVPFKEGFGYLAGAVAGTRIPRSGNRGDDLYDVFYMRLEPEIVDSLHEDFLFLDANDCDPFDVTAHNDVYTMIGYPARKSQTDEHSVSTAQFCYSGDGVDDSRYEQLHCQRKSHILVQHRRGKAVRYTTMRRSSSPHPEGMSGGGVFAWNKNLPKLSALQQPQLAGIITEYHESRNVFVATRLHLYLLAIHRNNPDLPISIVPR